MRTIDRDVPQALDIHLVIDFGTHKTPTLKAWFARHPRFHLHFTAQGRGKRGGARVIYYWHVSRHHIYLIYGYVKSKREDLTLQQVQVLAKLMKDVKDG